MNAKFSSMMLGVMPLLGSVLCSSVFAKGGSPKTIRGPQVQLFGETISSRFDVDAIGQVTAVELLIPMRAAEKAKNSPTQALDMALPLALQKDSAVQYITIDWNQHGHNPENVYQVPHFDFHFYFVAKDFVAQIDCQDLQAVPQNLIPSGYVLAPVESPDYCVPQMGIHALPQADLNPYKRFTETPIFGYYAGRLIFFEPMVTLDYILGKGQTTRTVSYPQAFLDEVTSSYLPNTYSLGYDAATDSYRIRFSTVDE